jgi:hypothetical protein
MEKNNQCLTDILKLAHYNNDLNVAQNYLDKALEKNLSYAQMICYVKSHYLKYLFNKSTPNKY